MTLNSTAAIVFRAPVRLDFGGGWTDVPPYPERDGGFVCNAAIRLYATVRVEPLEDPSGEPEIDVAHDGDRRLVMAAVRRLAPRGVRVGLRNDFPVGAGLGGSSAAGVALVGALSASQGRQFDRDEAAELSRDIEIGDLGIAGGRQDHYAAAHGGVLGLRFGARVEVHRVALAPEVAEELCRRCVLIYTGQSRISGDTINAVLDAYVSGAPRVTFALSRMRALAEAMPELLERGDIDGFAALVGEQWAHQRALHPRITTERIDQIMETARQSGAAGGKALGASGGGCVLLIAREDTRDAVLNAVAPLGEILPVSLDFDGARLCP